MQLTNTLVASLVAASAAVAAPAPGEVSMMAAVPKWTIENMKRVCDKADKLCTWTFGINTHQGPTTACKHAVQATNGVGASRSNGGPLTCGRYTVTSGWSGQFGEGRGFTTLSVVDYEKRLITFPAYTDNQVNKGNVKPDQSYAPQNLPAA